MVPNSFKCNLESSSMNSSFAQFAVEKGSDKSNHCTANFQNSSQTGTQFNGLLLSAKGSKDLNYGIGRRITGIKSFRIEMGPERIKTRDQIRD